MNKMWQWIIGILGGGLGLAILGFAMQFWIHLNVKAQLLEAGIVPKAEVTALDTRIRNLEKIHDKDIIRIETKSEAIARILMEE